MFGGEGLENFFENMGQPHFFSFVGGGNGLQDLDNPFFLLRGPEKRNLADNNMP